MFMYDVKIKILSLNQNYIVNVIIRPKFANCSISMREVIISLILWRFGIRNYFFEKCSWFVSNNLEQSQGMDFKFYTSVEKELKLKFGESSELIG